MINVSGTLEELIAECVGDAPEAVLTKDWRGIALRLMRRMEERGLVIELRRRTPKERGRIAGPIMDNETILAIGVRGNQAVICSTGAPMSVMPEPLRKQVWHDMLDQALADLAEAKRR